MRNFLSGTGSRVIAAASIPALLPRQRNKLSPFPWEIVAGKSDKLPGGGLEGDKQLNSLKLPSHSENGPLPSHRVPELQHH